MGQNGRRFILARYQRPTLAWRYAELLAELTDTGRQEKNVARRRAANSDAIRGQARGAPAPACFCATSA